MSPERTVSCLARLALWHTGGTSCCVATLERSGCEEGLEREEETLRQAAIEVGP